MAHLFKDEGMKDGSVEPEELAEYKKRALDQAKVNLIKSTHVV